MEDRIGEGSGAWTVMEKLPDECFDLVLEIGAEELEEVGDYE
jgi:hypothetical protein